MLKSKKSLTGLSIFTGLILNIPVALANPNVMASVNSQSCETRVGNPAPFILVLDSGEDVLKSITDCAEKAKIKGATIHGLGQLHNPTLAYFTSNPTDVPTLQSFPGYYELASINGNVSNTNNQYYTHTHVVLADRNFHGIAGHLNHAIVGVTAEITMIPLAEPLERTVDPKTGFGPIVHK